MNNLSGRKLAFLEYQVILFLPNTARNDQLNSIKTYQLVQKYNASTLPLIDQLYRISQQQLYETISTNQLINIHQLNFETLRPEAQHIYYETNNGYKQEIEELQSDTNSGRRGLKENNNMKKEDVNDDILHSNNRSPDHTTEDILTLSVVVTPPSSPNIQNNNASDLFISQKEQQTELDSRRSAQQFSTPIPSFFIPIINQSQIIPQQLEQVINSKQQEQQLISDGAFNVQMIDQIPIGQALALFLNGYQQCDEDEQKLILSHIRLGHMRRPDLQLILQSITNQNNDQSQQSFNNFINNESQFNIYGRMDIEDYEQKELNKEQMLYQALSVDDDAQLDKDNQITDSSNIQQPIIQNQRIRMRLGVLRQVHQQEYNLQDRQQQMYKLLNSNSNQLTSKYYSINHQLLQPQLQNQNQQLHSNELLIEPNRLIDKDILNDSNIGVIKENLNIVTENWVQSGERKSQLNKQNITKLEQKLGKELNSMDQILELINNSIIQLRKLRINIKKVTFVRKEKIL